MCVYWTLAILAVLSGARAGSALTSEPCDCTGQCRPTMTATIPRETSTRVQKGSIAYIHVLYGEVIDIFCSGRDPRNLRIHNGEKLEVTIFNSTTIRLALVTPNVGTHTYVCLDTETSCEDLLDIKVDLKMYVSGQGVHLKQLFDKYLMGFVILDQNYDVFCSGDQVGSLSISSNNNWSGVGVSNLLPVEAVNETTIKHSARADCVGKWYYYCKESITNTSRWTNVIVSHFPEAKNFRCITYNLRSLECSWNSLHKNNIFRLFKKDSSTTFLCRDDSRRIERECKSNMRLERYSFPFMGLDDVIINDSELLMETCNQVFCSNETFILNHEAILKFDRPLEFKLLNVSSGSVTVGWRRADVPGLVRLDHRLEYQLLGTSYWRQANTSSASCVAYGHCKFQLNLQCPNAHYKLKLYVKPAAATEEFWSEPAYLFFFTEKSPGAVVNPGCTGNKGQRKRLPSADEMLNEIEQLVIYEREKELRLEMKIGALMDKRKKVNELMDLLSKM